MTQKTEPDDERWMDLALTLAQRGKGRTAPNPFVGCVLVREGRVVGRGWTGVGGRPHAEAEALRRAGSASFGATAYVTLEPCNHHGKTPPCTEALIHAGIRRCVVALEDPDPRVAGCGLRCLRNADISVTVGVRNTEALRFYAGYLRQRLKERPSVTLKLATTLDGRIATRRGQSQWITGSAARAAGQYLRSTHDAVMVGSGTAVADNPRLSVRLPGIDRIQPLRVVVDGRLRLPLTHHLVTAAKAHPTFLVTRPDVSNDRRAAYKAGGVEVVAVPVDAAGMLSIADAVAALGQKGVTRVLVEGGSVLAASLIRADLVDEIVWFRAPWIIGGDGIPAISGFGLQTLDEMPGFSHVEGRPLGPDHMDIYRRAT